MKDRMLQENLCFILPTDSAFFSKLYGINFYFITSDETRYCGKNYSNWMNKVASASKNESLKIEKGKSCIIRWNDVCNVFTILYSTKAGLSVFPLKSDQAHSLREYQNFSRLGFFTISCNSPTEAGMAKYIWYCSAQKHVRTKSLVWSGWVDSWSDFVLYSCFHYLLFQSSFSQIQIL